MLQNCIAGLMFPEIRLMYATKLQMVFSNGASVPTATEGFIQIWKLTGKNYHFIMESTGVYQLPFCFFLESKKAMYSVVNALADQTVHTDET